MGKCDDLLIASFCLLSGCDWKDCTSVGKEGDTSCAFTTIHTTTTERR